MHFPFVLRVICKGYQYWGNKYLNSKICAKINQSPIRSTQQCCKSWINDDHKLIVQCRKAECGMIEIPSAKAYSLSTFYAKIRSGLKSHKCHIDMHSTRHSLICGLEKGRTWNWVGGWSECWRMIPLISWTLSDTFSLLYNIFVIAHPFTLFNFTYFFSINC